MLSVSNQANPLKITTTRTEGLVFWGVQGVYQQIVSDISASFHPHVMHAHPPLPDHPDAGGPCMIWGGTGWEISVKTINLVDISPSSLT